MTEVIVTNKNHKTLLFNTILYLTPMSVFKIKDREYAVLSTEYRDEKMFINVIEL